MKFLKMYSQMDNHQMVEGLDKSFIDTKNICEYTLETCVKNRKNVWVGSAIVCRSKNNIFYLTPPLDYMELERECKYSALDNKIDEWTEKKNKFALYLKKMECFIPYLLKTIKFSNDETVLEVVVEDNQWVIKEVGE